jgi:hypothetical protein
MESIIPKWGKYKPVNLSGHHESMINILLIPLLNKTLSAY